MEPIFIYRSKLTSDVLVEYLPEAKYLEDHADWEHIATIEPKAYLQKILNDSDALINELIDA